MKEKVSKGRADQGDLDVLEKANKVELLNFNKTCSQEVRLNEYITHYPYLHSVLKKGVGH